MGRCKPTRQSYMLVTGSNMQPLNWRVTEGSEPKYERIAHPARRWKNKGVKDEQLHEERCPRWVMEADLPYSKLNHHTIYRKEIKMGTDERKVAQKGIALQKSQDEMGNKKDWL
eukprot:c30883_g1_i1 orf=225-566(+)